MTHLERRSTRSASAGGWQGFTAWQRAVPALAMTGLLLMVLGLTLTGCGSKGPARAPGVMPMPTYTGPAFLRGTIGSLVRLRAGTGQPLLVSGYGIVVNLNGTGSTSAPPVMRQALINQMRRYGLGSARLKTLDMSPERVLADPNTTVVRIDGLIPPGATPGLRFDVLVTSVDSQTTSLAGGTLWTASLGINGAVEPFRFVREQALASGPIYDNPYKAQADSGQPNQFSGPQAIVVAGGKVTAARDLELVLNQSSYSRCRAIADRINERFGMTTDKQELAKPLTDQLIRINVPPRFQSDPGQLVQLIMHLYLQTGPGFEESQVRRLADELRKNPEMEESVRYAWQGLGRPIVEVLREYYEDEQLSVRLPALEAGAWLGDERASQSLSDLVEHPDPAIRTRVARALVLLPRSITGSRTLKTLLDDADVAVRVAAYESLSTINDRMITKDRVLIPDESGTDVKYIIDTVPSDRPLVYITQVGVPRIVIFNPDLGFKFPLLAALWDNRLMLKVDPETPDILDVFYQPYYQEDSQTNPSIQLKAEASLKTLVFLLGHRPTVKQPEKGLDLTYSQVVDVVYQLCQQGQVDAPIQVVGSSLAKQIADMENRETMLSRPETATEPTINGQQEGADQQPSQGPATRPDTTYNSPGPQP